MTDPNPSQTPDPVSQLLDDQKRRWQQGERILVETYLVQQPDLHARVERLLSLIANEIGLRAQAGEQPDLLEYVQRFPQLETALRQQFEGYRVPGLEADGRSGSSPCGSSITTIGLNPGEQGQPVGSDSPSTSLGEAETKWRGLLAPAQRPEELGRLGAYAILEVLGAGGMGAVFRGRDDELGRDIAVKVILEKHHDQSGLRRRFVEEAQICGQLQHPGVVPIYELGRINDQQPYFTMKLVQGQTLTQLFKARMAASRPGHPAADLPRFVTIFGQVCQAMAYAHAQGVIHRDLKPGNVMVGTFGEVQVMDWGLAKILTPPGAAAREVAPPAPEPTVTAVDDGVPSETSSTPTAEARTATGSVLGTPAYMPPEQARGEVQHLDPRCDVFALGAILCQILTGKPPYENPAFAQALQGDLAGAFQRLDACGADTELIALARRCLQPQREDRPRDAGEVAAAVTAYQESVQTRAQEERQRREVAQTRAEEERKRQRLTAALALAILVLVLGASGVGLWFQHDQVRRQTELASQRAYLNQEVAAALDEAERFQDALHQKLADPMQTAALLSNLDEWQNLLRDTRAAWQRAQTLAGGHPDLMAEQTQGRLETLGRWLPEGEKQFAVVRKLNAIRLDASTMVEGKFLTATSGPRYEDMFRNDLGLDMQHGDPLQLADQVKQSPIRHALVAALDHWIHVTSDPKLRPRLLAVTRRADPDPWRDRVRDEKTWASVPRLRALAAEVRPERNTPQILSLLALRMRFGSVTEAAALLRAALLHHPKDFWLHFSLGNVTQDTGERAGCFRAALALQPNNSAVLNNLGNTLVEQKDLGGAVACYHKAIALHPKLPLTHFNLGKALHAQKDLGGAVTSFEQAIALDPKYTPAHINLGLVLRDQKNLRGAAAAFHKAIALDRTDALPHNNLGLVLHEQKNLGGAVTAYQKAIQLDAKFAQPHNNLGLVLHEQKNLGGAAAAFQKAVALDPQYTLAHYNLGVVLREQQDVVGAITSFQKAIQLDPHYAPAHYNLGNAFHGQKHLAEAVTSYQKAITLDAKFVKAYNNLGTARLEQKKLKEAVACFQQAIALDPAYANAHVNLAVAYIRLGRFAEARKVLRQGHELGSNPSATKVLKASEQLLALDQLLTAVLAGQVKPKNSAEQLALADLCWRYKQQYATAARFYAAVFTAEPKTAEKLNSHRYLAAGVAALAGTSQGQDADLGPQELAKLRRQALDWLHADLESWQRQVHSDQPKVIRALMVNLSRWLSDPNLTSIRAMKELAQLPQEEQAGWQKLWTAVKLLSQAAKVRLPAVEQWQGTLTARQREQTQEVELQAGKTYVIDLESAQFDTYLKLQDAQGKTLNENDDSAPTERNSLLVFTPAQDGTYRLVATSHKQKGTGAYTLTVRLFIKKEK